MLLVLHAYHHGTSRMIKDRIINGILVLFVGSHIVSGVGLTLNVVKGDYTNGKTGRS